MSDYYDHGGAPADTSYGDSSVIRAELTAIQNGISKKLPPLSGSAGKVVTVNAGATKLTTEDSTGTGAFVRSTSPTIISPTGLVKADVGLANVDNTSDANKPVSTAQATAINAKADKGANSDITSLSGLTTALSIAQGGTGGTTQATAQSALSVYSIAQTDAADTALGLTKMGIQYLQVQDQKASGTGGGTSAAGFNDRTLNTVVANTITGASVASNQVTLPSGTYRVEGWTGAAAVNQLQSHLYNVTDAAVTVVGAPCYSQSAGGVGVNSQVSGRFTIAATKVFKLRTYCAVVSATNGLGFPASSGQIEVFSSLTFTKE